MQQKEKILQQEKEKLKGRMPGKFDKWLTLRFTDAQVGSRPISDRMASISGSRKLTSRERKPFFAYLLNREMAEKVPPIPIGSSSHCGDGCEGLGSTAQLECV